MKKILIALLISVLPAMVIAADAEPSKKAEPKKHTMQNTDPTPDEAVKAPKHSMQNTDPTPDAKDPAKSAHKMKNN